MGRKNPWIAAVLNFLLPGTGSIYCETAPSARAKQNLTYCSGGKFDIGIMVNKAEGGIVGYEMGDREFAVKNAIEISPPEVLIQIENGNTMRGLAWIVLSLPFLIAGLTGLVEIVRYDAQGS